MDIRGFQSSMNLYKASKSPWMSFGTNRAPHHPGGKCVFGAELGAIGNAGGENVGGISILVGGFNPFEKY